MSYAPTSYCTVALEKKEEKKKEDCMTETCTPYNILQAAFSLSFPLRLDCIVLYCDFAA